MAARQFVSAANDEKRNASFFFAVERKREEKEKDRVHLRETQMGPKVHKWRQHLLLEKKLFVGI